MRFSAKVTSDGVTERLFMIGDVPGVRRVTCSTPRSTN
jgi:hypothetical protein